MRAAFFRKTARPVRVIPRWSGLAVGLIGSICLWTICRAENPDKKLARLGFAFDQHAHDLAVTAVKEQDSTETQSSDEAASDDLLKLPKFVVLGKKVPFQDREILTPKGRLDLAKKTYLTPAYQKTLGPLSALAGLLMNPLGGWQPNNPEAMVLYEDTEQLRRKTEMQELEKKLPQ